MLAISLAPRTMLSCFLVFFMLTIVTVGLGLPSVTQAQNPITVNTSTDELNIDSDCSLREAIQAANTDSAVDACTPGSGNDTIKLPAGTFILSLPGAQEDNNATGDLDIKGHLIITGAGAESTIINGNQLDRVLHIHSGFTLTINGAKITNGKTAAGVLGLDSSGQPGAGIYNSGMLTLNDSIVGGNITGNGSFNPLSAGGSGGAGGGIYNVGIMTLNNSKVSENITGNAGGCSINLGCFSSGGRGGGIFNGGTLTLNNSTISSNITGKGHPARNPFDRTAIPDGFGGGIFNIGILTLNNSTVISNTTGNGFPSDPFGSFGGAGGGIASVAGSLMLNNSILSGNAASGVGGGLALFGLSGSNVTLINTVILENQASDTGAGIYIQGGQAQMLHTTISANSGHDGSGIYVTNQNYAHLFSRVVLTNTILVRQTVGIRVTPPNTVVLNGVLWFENRTNTGGDGTVIVTNEHVGHPAFAADGYHLTNTSAAVDTGVRTTVSTDIDYDPRFNQPDLGADELITFPVTRIYLPLIAHNP